MGISVFIVVFIPLQLCLYYISSLKANMLGKKPKQDIVRNKFLHIARAQLFFSVGLCGTGAHPPLSALHARQLHPPAQDCTLTGHQPQRPAHLVCPCWSLPHCVRLHQEPHHSHPVSQHNLLHTHESDKMQNYN